MSLPNHVVIDTNVLYAALHSRRGESRRLLDDVFDGALIPHVSVPLVLEYEAVLVREASGLVLVHTYAFTPVCSCLFVRMPSPPQDA